IRASRLSIPSVGIDAAVQPSETVPDTSSPPPGCPVPPPSETQTVPNEGIATPTQPVPGLENKSWIFGHSRYLGRQGVFFTLQDLSIGDEMFVDGTERTTGEKVVHQRFVVDGMYLTDLESGDRLITAHDQGEMPARPTVFLQTSVREYGAGKQWILSQS